MSAVEKTLGRAVAGTLIAAIALSSACGVKAPPRPPALQPTVAEQAAPPAAAAGPVGPLFDGGAAAVAFDAGITP